MSNRQVERSSSSVDALDPTFPLPSEHTLWFSRDSILYKIGLKNHTMNLWNFWSSCLTSPLCSRTGRIGFVLLFKISKEDENPCSDDHKVSIGQAYQHASQITDQIKAFPFARRTQWTKESPARSLSHRKLLLALEDIQTDKNFYKLGSVSDKLEEIFTDTY